MYTITKERTFSAAHSIAGHGGECKHLHGHNYRVRVALAASELDALGMVVDFDDVERHLGEIVAPFDHRLLNEVPPFDERGTTAEVIAAHVCGELDRRIGDDRVRVTRVEVWEDPTSCAVFEPD